MAKKQNLNQISTSLHYLIKEVKDGNQYVDEGFTDVEFERILDRVRNTAALDLQNDDVVSQIKFGYDLPFLTHEQIDESRYFGCFEAAYYGHEYRNSRHGRIDADSLNLRRFYYLLSRRRDGKIVVGTQYFGNYGDYEGLKTCFMHLLRGNAYRVRSRSFSSFQHEIGEGVPVEIQVNFRRQQPLLGRPSIFSKTGMFVIKKSNYGEAFEEHIRRDISQAVRGDVANRKRVLGDLLRQGELLEIDDDDIEGCSVIVRNNGRQHTVYLLGGTTIATKFAIRAALDQNGIPRSNEVRDEMLRVLDDIVTPGMR